MESPRKKQELLFEGHTDYVQSIAITRDNQFIVSGSYDKTIIIWNLKKKAKEAVLQGHNDDALSLGVTTIQSTLFLVEAGRL